MNGPTQTLRMMTLRNQKLDTGIHSALWAWVDQSGDLHLDGQDLGLPPGMMSDDAEYEYFKVIAAQHLPALIDLLGGRQGDDLLDLVARDRTGPASFDLERILHEAPFPIEFHSC